MGSFYFNSLYNIAFHSKQPAHSIPMKTPPINTKYINTIPVLLSSTVACLIAYFYHWEQYFSPLMLGIIAGGLVDLDNGLTGKLKNLWFTLIAFTISSLSVQITFNYPIIFTITFTALAFVFTMLGAAGNRYRTIAFGTLAVAVYTSLTHDVHAPLYLNSMLILCGTLLYSGATLLTHIVFPHRPVQESMANTYLALATYLEAKAEFFDPDEAEHLEQQQITLAMNNTRVIDAFNHTRSALFYRMRGQHRHPRTARMLRYYFIAQDIHERISSSHVHYQAFAEQMKHSDLIFRLRRLLRLQAKSCREFAGCLRQNTDFSQNPKLERATQGAIASLEYYAQHATSSEIAPYRVQRLLDNIAHVSMQLAHLGNPATVDLETDSEQSRIQSAESSGFKGAFRSLRQQSSLHSPTFRHAVRMGIIVLACCTIVQLMHGYHVEYADLSLGYWILLTAVFVCQPNYSATKKRLIQRIIGTVGGVLVGSALPILSLTIEAKLLIVALTITLFFFFRTNKHSYATFFITIQALMAFSIMGMDTTTFFIPRAIDTIVGASIAGAAVYFLWPDWKYLSLEKNASAAISSQAGYLTAVLQELQHGISDNVLYRAARRQSHDKAAALSSTLSDMSSEPDKHANQLSSGFQLLKMNYSLISYISALGAYRDKIQQNSEAEQIFFAYFYPAAEQIVHMLQHINTWQESEFQNAFKTLQQHMEDLRQHTDHSSQSQVLWQQLMMISELLQPCYSSLHALHHINEAEKVQAAFV